MSVSVESVCARVGGVRALCDATVRAMRQGGALAVQLVCRVHAYRERVLTRVLVCLQ
jgi:hypothetical protein